MNAPAHSALTQANTMKPLENSGSRPRYGPHDLFWVTSRKALVSHDALPDWACTGRLAHAPVVMRREQVGDPSLLPVGLRGETRSQRFSAYVQHDDVLRVVRPETLVRNVVWQSRLTLQQFPAVIALDELAPFLDSSGLHWGPTGSTGFTLATGLTVLHPDSDLDLMVRAPAPLTLAQTAILETAISKVPCRVDMQIDTGRGAFSFAEWASGSKRVLLKTDTGPMLIADPWNPGASINSGAQRKP
jgi:phosphoribosyl-dephospho-CoA transferase